MAETSGLLNRRGVKSSESSNLSSSATAREDDSSSDRGVGARAGEIRKTEVGLPSTFRERCWVAESGEEVLMSLPAAGRRSELET